MKKKLADEIGKAFIRLHCPHWYWQGASPFEIGNRSTIVCKRCGKKKFLFELKDYEVLDE